MANEYWKMRGSYKSPLPIARDRELLVDMNNGDVYFGWNGSNVPLSNVAELQTLVSLLLAKKILNVDESFGGKSGYVVSVGATENGFTLVPPLKGDKGDTPTIRIGSVATGAPGSDVTITNSGTDTDVVLHIAIPRGYDGDMLAATYDTDMDGKVNSAEVADSATSVPWDGIGDKPTSFPPSLHSHSITEVTDLDSALSGKEPSLNNPDTDGKILSSTASGSRSWVAGVLSTVLTGLSTATNAAIAATDDVIAAFGKLQAQITGIKGQKVLFALCVYPNADLTSATVALPFAMTVDTITIAGRTASNATKAPSASTNAVLYKDGSALDTRAFTTADTAVSGLSVSLAAGLYDLRLSAVNGYTGATDKVTVTWSGVRA